MARLREWMDLSEWGNFASLTENGWTDGGQVSVSSTHFTDTNSNGGSYSLQVASYQFGDKYAATPALATPLATFYTRFHFRFDTFIYGDFVPFQWRKGSTVMGRILVNASTGVVSVQRGAGAATLATSTHTMVPNTWYTVELRMTIGASGTYELRVDSSSVGWVPQATGNTKPGSDTTVDNLWFGVVGGPAGMNVFFDDISSDDTAFVGESIITGHVPTGAGNTTQLTPSAGSNWQNVDEVPPSGADYNSTTLVNKEDTYAHSALPGSALTVKTAYVGARVVRASGSGINTAYIVVRSGGIDYEDAGTALGSSYAIITRILNTDPATAAAWTVAHLNASEIGIRFDA